MSPTEEANKYFMTQYARSCIRVDQEYIDLRNAVNKYKGLTGEFSDNRVNHDDSQRRQTVSAPEKGYACSGANPESATPTSGAGGESGTGTGAQQSTHGKSSPPRFKKGDKVRCLRDHDSINYTQTINDIYTVFAVVDDDQVQLEEFTYGPNGDQYARWSAGAFQLIINPLAKKFKVGDRVRRINVPDGDIDVGSVHQVTRMLILPTTRSICLDIDKGTQHKFADNYELADERLFWVGERVRVNNGRYKGCVGNVIPGGGFNAPILKLDHIHSPRPMVASSDLDLLPPVTTDHPYVFHRGPKASQSIWDNFAPKIDPSAARHLHGINSKAVQDGHHYWQVPSSPLASLPSEIKAALDELIDVYKNKANDYADDDNPFSNFENTAEQLGIDDFGDTDAVLVNVIQKIGRLKALRANGRLDDPANETVLDTYKDLAVYTVILFAMAKDEAK